MKKILACDDDEVLLSLLKFKLSTPDCEVITFTDGKKVLKYIKKEYFDLLLIDLYMPFYSGLEIISYLRKKLNSRKPVIVLSAEGIEQTMSNAFSIGADDYVTKPFSIVELKARVTRYLNKDFSNA
ncbi:MAG TPA: response regulator transcription factor [Cyclobacteriaceae bacterium]|jgi:DNA-binding response OmpR family regulator